MKSAKRMNTEIRDVVKSHAEIKKNKKGDRQKILAASTIVNHFRLPGQYLMMRKRDCIVIIGIMHPGWGGI